MGGAGEGREGGQREGRECQAEGVRRGVRGKRGMAGNEKRREWGREEGVRG